jgi:ferritin
MSASRFADRLTAQVANEFAASQQYIAIAAHYDADALPQLAGLFYRQSVEERNHAMIMIQYLLDADEPVVIPGVDAPQTAFSGLAEPVALALDQEKRVSDQCADLVRVARESGDFAGEQFMQWFIKEQIEEVAKMSTLLRVVERAGDDALRVEEFLAREGDGGDGGGTDPSMPAAAGGAL